MEKLYKINEIFLSLQGEGVRAGTVNIFIRFAQCDLKCSFCDTEFESFVEYSLDDIINKIQGWDCKNIIFTGGEPSLQLDNQLVERLKSLDYYLAIETNGRHLLPVGIDWICVSPKSAEHTLKIKRADEVKYVRHIGQGIPVPSIDSPNYLISPEFDGDRLTKENLDYCIELVKSHPNWRLSLQQHKFWKIR